jgi:hypothetical protein
MALGLLVSRERAWFTMKRRMRVIGPVIEAVQVQQTVNGLVFECCIAFVWQPDQETVRVEASGGATQLAGSVGAVHVAVVGEAAALPRGGTGPSGFESHSESPGAGKADAGLQCSHARREPLRGGLPAVAGRHGPVACGNESEQRERRCGGVPKARAGPAPPPAVPRIRFSRAGCHLRLRHASFPYQPSSSRPPGC